jgi:hypothetical protein
MTVDNPHAVTDETIAEWRGKRSGLQQEQDLPQVAPEAMAEMSGLALPRSKRPMSTARICSGYVDEFEQVEAWQK